MTADHDEALREFAAALFTDPDDPAEQPAEDEPRPGNVVPAEGKTPATPPRDQMRDFTRDLFGYDD